MAARKKATTVTTVSQDQAEEAVLVALHEHLERLPLPGEGAVDEVLVVEVGQGLHEAQSHRAGLDADGVRFFPHLRCFVPIRAPVAPWGAQRGAFNLNLCPKGT